MRVTLHRYTAVATWRWLQAPEDDVCGICQNAYEATCPDDTCKYPGEGCPIGTYDLALSTLRRVCLAHQTGARYNVVEDVVQSEKRGTAMSRNTMIR